MKSRYACIALFTLVCLRLSAQEETVRQFSHSYFRSDPFNGAFSGFIQRLMNDPLIVDRDSHKKSDTSLFYFYGVYKNYNPFFFKPTRVEILLEEVPVQFSDSINYTDTILVYQLMAYNNADANGVQEIKKEFDKIHRQYNKKFYRNNFVDLKEGETISGGVHNYFAAFYGLAPVSIAWRKLGTNESVLNITMRMKTSNNEAVLAAPFYKPK